MAQKTLVLSLYRRILKNAKFYPSIKKEEIILGIKEEFRMHKDVEDEKTISQCIEGAQIGLKQLERYAKLDTKSDTWSIDLNYEKDEKKT